jgi:cell fate (sporulation/competence/biofilm development) regulator YlbF (YheA/YmcA/DUF963 family)
METNFEDPTILQKTRELCQAIIEQPNFEAIRRQVDAFLADEKIRTQYQELSECSALLQHKQQTGMPLDMTEIADFEQRRESFLNNPIAQGFLAAQQAMQHVQESVGQYVAKTYELGRMPQKDDLDSCGHGCGCSH